MNRHERRRRNKLLGLGNRALKLRCMGCDRAGRPMTKEHFFPSWLIEYADVKRDGIAWPNKMGLDWEEISNVNPDKAVIPLCDECNSSFGRTLEGPVASIFRALDCEEGISDFDAELLVRWLWKFEGLQWGVFRDPNKQTYSRIYTLHERVATSRAFNEIRSDLVLAIALARSNDQGREDWPMGLDTPVGENAITMSGVFRRIALVVSLARFADKIHPAFGQYAFGQPPGDRSQKIFYPPCTFLTARGAVSATQECGMELSELHDAFGRRMIRENEGEQSGQLILPHKKRILLPPM